MANPSKPACTCILGRPQKPTKLTFDMAMAIKDCPVHGKNKMREA